MFNVFENLSQEQESELRERMEILKISEEEINSLYLPYMIIDEISDEELLSQIRLKKQVKKEEVEEEIVTLEEEDEELDERISDLDKLISEKLAEEKSMNPEEEFNNIIKNANIIQPVKEEKNKKQRQPRKKSKEESINDEEEIKLKKSSISDDDLIKNLKILDVSAFQAYNNYNNGKKTLTPTYEVVLPQSGYRAKMRGLKADEIDMLKNSINVSAESSREILEKIVFDCIDDTGLDDFSIDDFKNQTSVTDFDILLFGILHQTYGELNEFGLTCNHCGNSFNRKIITSDLIQAKDGEIQDIVNGIINSKDANKTLANSMLNTYRKLIRIPETDMIVEIKFSSLNRERRLLPYFKEIPSAERSTRRFYITMSASMLLLPQYDAQGNLLGHAKVESPVEIFNFLENVPSTSFYEVINEINRIVDEYTITFKTPEVKCPKCREMVNKHNVSISEYFLYQTLTEGL